MYIYINNDINRLICKDFIARKTTKDQKKTNKIYINIIACKTKQKLGIKLCCTITLKM